MTRDSSPVAHSPASEVRNPEPVIQVPEPVIQAPEPVIRNSVPSISLASIGTSVGAIKMRREGIQADADTSTQLSSETIAKKFDNQQLQFKWHEICDKLPSIDVANAERMKSLKVEILSFPKIRVTISNSILEKFMLGIKPELTRALGMALENNELTLDYHLADIKELSSQGLTRKEIFTKMIQESKGMELLQKEFKLELV